MWKYGKILSHVIILDNIITCDNIFPYFHCWWNYTFNVTLLIEKYQLIFSLVHTNGASLSIYEWKMLPTLEAHQNPIQHICKVQVWRWRINLPLAPFLKMRASPKTWKSPDRLVQNQRHPPQARVNSMVHNCMKWGKRYKICPFSLFQGICIKIG